MKLYVETLSDGGLMLTTDRPSTTLDLVFAFGAINPTDPHYAIQREFLMLLAQIWNASEPVDAHGG